MPIDEAAQGTRSSYNVTTTAAISAAKVGGGGCGCSATPPATPPPRPEEKRVVLRGGPRLARFGRFFQMFKFQPFNNQNLARHRVRPLLSPTGVRLHADAHSHDLQPGPVRGALYGPRRRLYDACRRLLKRPGESERDGKVGGWRRLLLCLIF